MDGDPILPTIERSVWLPSEPEALWGRLTDGGFLSTWFEADVRIEPRPGGRIEQAVDDGAARWGTVEVVEPARTIQWSWRTDEGDPSLVRIDLAAEDGGTRLTVTESLLEYEMTFHPQVGDGSRRWLPRVPIG